MIALSQKANSERARSIVDLESIVSIPVRNHLRNKFQNISDDEFGCVLIEFLKFIALSGARGGESRIPVGRAIDLLWHECILQTRFYRELCLTLAGKFIDHGAVIASESSESKSKNCEEYAEDDFSWMVSYVTNFGPFTEAAAIHWTIVGDAVRTNGWSLERLNEILLISEKFYIN